MSNFNQIVFVTESRTKGFQCYTAFTPWKDEITGRQLELKFHFNKAGKDGWDVTNQLIGLKTTVPTIEDARYVAQGAIDELKIDGLTDVEIWRNSGGFLCVGGHYGDWYIYAAKAPYRELWDVRATSGRNEKIASPCNATAVVGIKWVINNYINGKGLPTPEVIQPEPEPEPTPEPVNPLAWLDVVEADKQLDNYRGMIDSVKNIPLTDQQGFDLVMSAIRTERYRLLDEQDDAMIVYALTDKGRAVLA